MDFKVTRAKRKRSKLRLALIGPSGAGKTYTGLRVARGLAGPTGRILVIDTEHGSASLYADMPECAGEFDVIELDTFSPQTYTEALEFAARQSYDVVFIDSLSHAWVGKDGALEQVDAASRRARENKFAGWRDVTPVHNRMIDTIISAPFHLIASMRSKMEYVQEKDPQTGKTVIRKVGLQPVQRDGMEYEFTVVGDLDESHNLIISKSRCSALADKVFHRPNGEVSRALLEWLDGAEPEGAPAPAPNADHVIEKKRLYAELGKVIAELGITKEQAATWVSQNFQGQAVKDLDIFDLRAVEPGLRKAFMKQAELEPPAIDEPPVEQQDEIDF